MCENCFKEMLKLNHGCLFLLVTGFSAVRGQDTPAPGDPVIFKGRVDGNPGQDQNYKVPNDVDYLDVKLWGAGGGAEHLIPKHVGGAGGFVHARISVKPGSVLTVVCGDGGRSGNTASSSWTQSNMPYGFGGLGACPNGNSGCTSVATHLGGSCKNYPWYGSGWGREVGDGGGLAGIFAGTPSRANALLVAGGGGGGCDGRNGVSAKNAVDAPGLDCSEMKGKVHPGTHTGGGGGGYCGSKPGYGGSNFIHENLKAKTYIIKNLGGNTQSEVNQIQQSGGYADSECCCGMGDGGAFKTNDCNKPFNNAIMGGQSRVIIRPIKAKITTTTVTSTTMSTTISTTTIPGHSFAEVYEEFGKTDQAVSSMKTDINTAQAQADKALDHSEKAKVELTAEIAAMRAELKTTKESLNAAVALLNTLLKPVAVPQVTAKKCQDQQTGALCNPLVEVHDKSNNVDGPTLAIKALGGGVVFETAECEETDLCEMKRQIVAILAKFEN